MSLAQKLLLDLADDETELNLQDGSENQIQTTPLDNTIGLKHSELEANDSKQEKKDELILDYEPVLLKDKKYNNDEYTSFSNANSYVEKIDKEMGILFNKLKSIYNQRFPELESLIPDPVLYIKTVEELMNDIGKTKTSLNLPNILSNQTIMVISISASSTKG
ncbi:MAG: U4/U6 small nuclear ribonucleoprotein Prp31, partial [Paramarteilia canceri]